MLLMNVRFNLTEEKFNQVDDNDLPVKYATLNAQFKRDIDSIFEQVNDLLDTLGDQLPDGVELDKD